MPFSRPTLTELVDRIRDDTDARLPGADSRLRRSVLDVFGRVLAGGFHGVYGLLDWLWRQLLPDTAEAGSLARWAAIWGVQRKAATPATGAVIATGTNGSIIPAGALLIRRDGQEFRTIAAAEVAGGVAELTVEATVAGSDGNTEPGIALTFSAPVAGVNAQATTDTALLSGNEEEADDALRGRLLSRIQRPPHGGNANDYVSWALEVAGVTRAWVYPGELGLGTVTVRFVCDDREDIIPEPADVDAVEEHIDVLRPVTAALTVVAPIPMPVDFILHALPPSVDVQDAIREELADLLRRESQPGGTLLISHIREAVSLAAGEMDHQLIQPPANVVAETGYLPVVGDISFI